MAVLHKSTVAAKAKQLDDYYGQLKQILEGRPVDRDIARCCVTRPEQADSIVDINIDKLLDAVAHFKVAVDSLRRLNSEAIKSVRTPYFYDGEPPPL